MRTATTDMVTSLGQKAATLARTWKFTRRDGKAVRLTDHDQPIRVGSEVYRSIFGFTPSAAVSSSTSFSSQQCEITLVLADNGVSKTDVLSRKWDRALAVESIVDWNNPTSLMPVFSGHFGRIQLSEKGLAVIEVLGLGNSSTKLANEIYSMTCRHSLGDAGCTVNLEQYRVNFTVAAVADKFTFTASDLQGQVDGYYAFGHIVWDTGANAGETSEVQSSLKLTNEVSLFYPPASSILIGDTGRLYPGCDLLIVTCKDKFANVLNFDGEPWNIQPRVISAPASSGSATPPDGGTST